MKVMCCCCARQIVDYCKTPDQHITRLPAVYMGPTLGYCCGECSKDLDENGLFPEERDNANIFTLS
jgi:hypothetical protein